MPSSTSTSNQAPEPGSAGSLLPRGQFPPLEAHASKAIIKNRPNRIILPPRNKSGCRHVPTPEQLLWAQKEGAAALDYLINARSGEYRAPQPISDIKQAEEISDEEAGAREISASVVSGPVPSMPRRSYEERPDSGFGDERRQRQIVDVRIDDENISSICTNELDTDSINNPERNTSTNTNTFTKSDVDSTPDIQHHPILVKSLQKVLRFIKSKPLKQLHDNIAIWKWEREQEKAINFEEEEQRKETEREQAQHMIPDTIQARGANDHVNGMKVKERKGNMPPMGSWSPREVIRDCFRSARGGRK